MPRALSKACRFCAESPLICVSGITGADLKDRIVRIMTEHLVQKLNLSRKLLLGGAGFASLGYSGGVWIGTRSGIPNRRHICNDERQLARTVWKARNNKQGHRS